MSDMSEVKIKACGFFGKYIDGAQMRTEAVNLLQALCDEHALTELSYEVSGPTGGMILCEFKAGTGIVTMRPQGR